MPSRLPSGATAVLTAVQALPFGVAIADSHGIVTWANAAYAQLTGYPSDELPGQSAGEFPWDALAHRTPSSEPWRVENVCRRKAGEVYTAKHTITTLRNPAGEATGFCITKQGITGLKQEGDAPHQAEASLSALIESTEDLIWSVDLSFGLLAFNKALRDHFERHLGIRAAFGMRPEDLSPPARAALWPPLYDRALAQGPFRAEYPLLDGRTLELSFNAI